MSIIRISGCSIGDDVYTTSAEILGEEIRWNVTRIQRDADAGKFGEATIVPMAMLPPMTDAMRQNVDWPKVEGMVRTYDLNPAGSIINKPALQVMAEIGGQLMRLPIDGNHRICARRLIGHATFACFVVPLEIERRYRVIEEVIRG
jgi:hypothetical protein